MKADIVKITPSLSKDWLEQNRNFRQPTESHIDKMAADILAGKWDENGETIKFNTNDELVDGQNRLMACIKAGKPFTSVVVYGVKSDLNIDVGSKRALKHYLIRLGITTYANQFSASLRNLYSLRKRGQIYAGGIGTHAPTNSQLVDFLKGEPDLYKSVTRTASINLVPTSILAPLFLCFSERDSALAEKYLSAIDGKLELKNTDPAIMLRDKFQVDKGSKYRMSIRSKAAYVIIAWNHWRSGTAPKFLRWTESGPTANDFPEVQ
jgi:hypothetical protein